MKSVDASAEISNAADEVRIQSSRLRPNNKHLILFTSLGLFFLLVVFILSIYLFGGSLLSRWIELPYTFDEKRISLILASALPAITLIYCAFTIGRSREPLPEGVFLDDMVGKSLKGAVDQIAKAIGTPAPDRIVITDEINAFAGEFAEDGPFQRKTTVLGLGLPLLRLLSLEQAAAVIAHEMGHFASRDNRVSRLYGTMEFATENVIAQCEESNYSAALSVVSLPLKGYLALAARLKSRVSRENEFAADQVASELFGDQNAADALISLDVLGEEFDAWLKMPLQQAWQNGDELPESIIRTTQDAYRTPSSRIEMERRMTAALKRKTGKWDSHPCLAERLANLGVKARLPVVDPGQTNAASALLTADEQVVHRALETQFRQKFSKRFGERADEVKKARILAVDLHERLSTLTASEAEALSLLLERSVPSKDSRCMHSDIIARFGPIPASVCEIGLDDVASERIEGAESLLEIFESRPTVSASAWKFLENLQSQRTNLPTHLQFLQAWIESGTVQSRISKALIAHELARGGIEPFTKSKPGLRAPDIAAWHRALIVEEITARGPVRRIWLAEFEHVPNYHERVFSVVIETQSDDDASLFEELAPRLCLPGNLIRDAAASMTISANAALRKRRDVQGALIYESASARLKKAA